MRGFLVFVGVLLLALLAAAFVLVPIVARPLVADVVRAATPFGNQPLDIEVDVEPVALLLGTIDRVRIRGTDLAAEGVRIAGLDLTLRGVSTRDRSFASLEGRMTDVSVPIAAGEPLVIDTIELTGVAGDVSALARLDLRAGLALVGNAVAGGGVTVENIELIDGGVSFVLFGQQVSVPIGVDAGALVLADVGGGGEVVLAEPGPDDPWRIVAVRVTPSGIDVGVALTAGS